MLQLKTLSLNELAQHSDQWDDLWLRSESRLPSKRCAGIQLWCQTFAPNAKLKVIVVEREGTWIAGLPLLKDRSCWPLALYRLPSNHTVRSGDLLIDPECDVQAATKAIAHQISLLDGSVAVLEGIEIDSQRWKDLLAAIHSLGRSIHKSAGHEVGVVDILHNWDAYKRSWSANHRSAVKRSLKKLEAEGEVRVERLRHASDTELYDTLEICFAIENRGWKRDRGTSILATPKLREYYHQEARMLRDIAALDLWLLKLNGMIIAFEYCQFSKGTCFSQKISFDPKFDRFSPGKVLRSLQLEQLHQDPAAKQLDTLGVMCESKAKWVTRTYKSSRCFVALGGHASNLALRIYKPLKGFASRKKQLEFSKHEVNPPTTERPGDWPETAEAADAHASVNRIPVNENPISW